MDRSNRDHPSEGALERFILQQCTENELEMIETHWLACDFCLNRLEILGVEIAVTKRALQKVAQQQSMQRTATLAHDGTRRVNRMRFLVASAVVAACFVCVFSAVPSRVGLSVKRGSEMSIVTAWRPIELQLDVKGLDPGSVIIQISDSQSATVWQGKASVVGEENINVRVPRFSRPGIYFVRILAVATFSAGRELAREFALRVQSPL